MKRYETYINIYIVVIDLHFLWNFFRYLILHLSTKVHLGVSLTYRYTEKIYILQYIGFFQHKWVGRDTRDTFLILLYYW